MKWSRQSSFWCVWTLHRVWLYSNVLGLFGSEISLIRRPTRMNATIFKWTFIMALTQVVTNIMWRRAPNRFKPAAIFPCPIMYIEHALSDPHGRVNPWWIIQPAITFGITAFVTSKPLDFALDKMDRSSSEKTPS